MFLHKFHIWQKFGLRQSTLDVSDWRIFKSTISSEIAWCFACYKFRQANNYFSDFLVRIVKNRHDFSGHETVESSVKTSLWNELISKGWYNNFWLDCLSYSASYDFWWQMYAAGKIVHKRQYMYFADGVLKDLPKIVFFFFLYCLLNGYDC